MKDFGFVKFENIHGLEKHLTENTLFYKCLIDMTFKNQPKELSVPFISNETDFEETGKWVWEQISLGNYQGEITIVDHTLDSNTVSNTASTIE